MKVIINNTCDLENKYVKVIEEKVNRLGHKFSHLLYAEVFLKSEGTSPEEYNMHIRLGIPGDDIIIKEKSTNPGENISRVVERMHRYLNRQKELMKN